MSLLPVAEALARLLDGIGPRASESVPLHDAAGRVLAEPLLALRTQPPFDASAMDGYAVRAADIATLPAFLTVIGEAPAGRPFEGAVRQGQAVRIFTGAPLPDGADTILIQEDARARTDGTIEATEATARGRHIRRRGLDFAEGEQLLDRGRILDPAALSLAAAANHDTLSVISRPRVSILATGDELVPPGSATAPGQIVSSNAYGVAALARDAGAQVADLGIVPDRRQAIGDAVSAALSDGADLIVTLGGASVGDHDLVRDVLTGLGMELDFWKIAMRPGKPLMFGRFGEVRVVGLPGNPVASLVCAHLFLKPMIATMAGRSFVPDMREARLAVPMSGNDQREDYVRAIVRSTPDGLIAEPFPIQDSSMLKTLAAANGLIVRSPHAAPASAGNPCRVLMLR